MELKLNSAERKQISTDLITLDVDEFDISGQRVRYVTTDVHSIKRNRSLLTKEPLTLPWISTFEPDDVYVDVGANVGMYAIYAGARGVKVYAFEPEALNYAELNKNIFVNDLHGRVKAYCMAISDAADVSVLYLSGFSVAYSHHDFGENRWSDDKTIGSVKLAKTSRLQQGCVSFPLDTLVSTKKIEPPNHLKIDVDGFEWKVVKGAQDILRSEELKTILLEVDFALPESVALIDHLTELGWHYSGDQIRINQHIVLPPGKIDSLKRRGKGGANYIFFKDVEFYTDFFRKFLETYVPPNPLSKRAAGPAHPAV